MSALTPRYRPTPTAWIDVAVVTVLSVVGVVGFTPAFGDWHYLGAALGGLLVGSIAGIAAALYRLPALLTALVAVAAYFLFGSLFAMSPAATLGFLPSLETISGLTFGAVFGWADIVTLNTPIGAPSYITVVPYVASWLVGLVSVTLALRWLSTRARFTPLAGAALLLGPAALLLAGILMGTEDPFYAAFRGVGFAVVALVWLGWRSRPTAENGGTRGRLVLRRKLVGTAALVAAAIAAGSLSGFVVSPVVEDRFVLRDYVEPPFDPLEFPSPLSAFRNYSKLNTDEVIMTVSGLREGDLVRLASLDSYDGVLWSVSGAQQASGGSGSYALVGQTLPDPQFEVDGTSELTVTIGEYEDVWLPSVGYATGVVFTGADSRTLAAGLRYNIASGTGIVTSGLKKGDTYRLESASPAEPGDLKDVSPASVSLPPSVDIQVVGAKALEFAGSAVSPFEKLDNIADYLATQGYLRKGLASEAPPSSRAGHGADRLIQLFSSTYMVGDAEQFASAFALMVRSLGYPSRVVMGFAPPEGATGTVEITGEDVTAWVEVAFDGVGWVPFYPTPEQTEVPQDQVPQPQTKPQPQVRQPPRSIENPEALVSPIEIDDEEKEEEDAFTIPGWVWVVAAWVGIPAAIYLLPLLLVGLIKRRRRQRRRTNGTPVDRVAAGWDEFLDSYAEFGYPLPTSRTRTQHAADVAQKAAVEPGSVLTLANDADRVVFSGRDADPAQVDAYWADAIAEIERMSGSAGRWRRFVNRFYVRPRKKQVAPPITHPPRR